VYHALIDLAKCNMKLRDRSTKSGMDPINFTDTSSMFHSTKQERWWWLWNV